MAKGESCRKGERRLAWRSQLEPQELAWRMAKPQNHQKHITMPHFHSLVHVHPSERKLSYQTLIYVDKFHNPMIPSVYVKPPHRPRRPPFNRFPHFVNNRNQARRTRHLALTHTFPTTERNRPCKTYRTPRNTPSFTKARNL